MTDLHFTANIESIQTRFHGDHSSTLSTPDHQPGNNYRMVSYLKADDFVTQTTDWLFSELFESDGVSWLLIHIDDVANIRLCISQGI